MKQCPSCAAEYDDSIHFCANEGRALVTKIAPRTRLCPHCANSIAEDAVECRFCKAAIKAAPAAPQWPGRAEEAGPVKAAAGINKVPLRSKIILIIGIVVFALGIFLIGGHRERNESQSILQQKLAALDAREKQGRDREQKLQSLEGELAKARQQLDDRDKSLAELKTKYEETKKDLTLAQARLTVANREMDRLAADRAQPVAKAASRSAGSTPPPPARTRVAEPGLYETVRPASVYDGPSTTGRVVSEIKKGIRVEVVRSVGDWLEVRSKHGKPPGFIRWNDAMFVSRAN